MVQTGYPTSQPSVAGGMDNSQLLMQLLQTFASQRPSYGQSNLQNRLNAGRPDYFNNLINNQSSGRYGMPMPNYPGGRPNANVGFGSGNFSANINLDSILQAQQQLQSLFGGSGGSGGSWPTMPVF